MAERRTGTDEPKNGMRPPRVMLLAAAFVAVLVFLVFLLWPEPLETGAVPESPVVETE